MNKRLEDMVKRIKDLPEDKQEIILFEINNMINIAEKEMIQEQREFECDLRGHTYGEWKEINMYQILDPDLASIVEEKYGNLYGGSVGYERVCSNCGAVYQTLNKSKELKKNK